MTATAKKRAAPKDPGPLSVALPEGLRARLRTEARRRGLKLSPVVRALLTERVAELDAVEELSRVEQWQRAEAWATWEKLHAGDRSEASAKELAADFDAALARVAPRKRR